MSIHRKQDQQCRPVRTGRSASFVAIRAAALATLGLAAASSGVRAADVQWNVADGNWADGINWNNPTTPNTPPGALDRALLDFAAGGTARVTTDVTDVFRISVINSNVLSIEPGGILTTFPEDLVTPPPLNDPLLAIRIGDGGIGSAIINDGSLINAATTLDQRSDIYVGVTDALAVGGAGTLTQNASGGEGTVSLVRGRDVRVGNGAGSVGTYNHNGGTVTINWGLTGRAGGTGTYNSNGGTVNSNNWRIADGVGSVGTWNFVGGAVNAAQESNIAVGGGVATVTHSGGILSTTGVTANLNIGRGAPSNTSQSSGTYNLGGTGSISVGQDLQIAFDGGIGRMVMTAGTVAVGRNMLIGTDSRGAASQILLSDGKLDQSGGTVNVLGALTVAAQKAKGIYNLTSAAALNVGTGATAADLLVGGSDSATDGLLTIADTAAVSVSGALRLGSGGGKGTVTMSGGTLNVTAGGSLIGQSQGGAGSTGRGQFDLNGGSATFGGNVTVGDGANVNGVMNIFAGTLKVNGNLIAGRQTTVSGVINQSGGTVTVNNLNIRTSTGSVAATDFNLTGGTLNANNVNNNSTLDYTGGTANIGGAIAGTGTTTVAAGLNLAANSVTQAAVNVDGKITVRPNATATGVSRIGAITLGAAGKIDLTDNKLITPMAAGTFVGAAYTGVAGLVDSGRGTAGNALWDGATGIVTSDTRAIDNSDLLSIGVVDASDKFRDGLGAPIAETATAVFAGQTVLGSDTLVMATWGGDANLDGQINIDDYGQIDSNVSKSGTVFGWNVGDFNYDGKINIDDYGIIDGNIGRQTGTIPTSGGVGASAGTALDGVAAVPEPGALALLGFGAIGALRRKRRGTA